MALFTHEDDEGDELEVMEALNDHRGQLVFNFACRPNSQGVFVTHDRVAALHAALGAWLELKNPLQSSVVENSLIDQLIVRRVAEEVARVLPLHQAPQAAGYPDEPKYEDARPRTSAANRLLSELTRMSDVAKRAAETVQESSRVWGTDGTSPNGPVPLCQARGCGHEYADHIRHAAGMAEECVGTPRCACVRYRSQT